MPSSATRRRVLSDFDVATMERTAPTPRAARAIEEPISPTPISASRLKMGVVLVTQTLRETGLLPPPLRGRGGERGRCGILFSHPPPGALRVPTFPARGEVNQ